MVEDNYQQPLNFASTNYETTQTSINLTRTRASHGWNLLNFEFIHVCQLNLHVHCALRLIIESQLISHQSFLKNLHPSPDLWKVGKRADNSGEYCILWFLSLISSGCASPTLGQLSVSNLTSLNINLCSRIRAPPVSTSCHSKNLHAYARETTVCVDCLQVNIVFHTVFQALRTGHPSIEELAEYHFDGQGKAFRPMVVMLVARACNQHSGTNSGWVRLWTW